MFLGRIGSRLRRPGPSGSLCSCRTTKDNHLDLPVILIVGHDALVRRAMQRDLERQFASDYQVRSVDSGRPGLDVIRECALHGQPVAMLLADQPMPR